MLGTNLKTRTSCPIFQNPRPSMVIMVKNGRNNGGRGREIKVPPWMSVLGMGGRRKEGGGGRRVLYSTNITAGSSQRLTQ
jgi:hypothetical protein